MFYFKRYGDNRYLNSFPTRRSSDLNYLEWLTDLPWKNSKGKKIDLKKSESILDEDHYGLKKVKERIVEYLAVHKLSDRKSTRLNSSHEWISYAVFCLKKKKKKKKKS